MFLLHISCCAQCCTIITTTLNTIRCCTILFYLALVILIYDDFTARFVVSFSVHIYFFLCLFKRSIKNIFSFSLFIYIWCKEKYNLVLFKMSIKNGTLLSCVSVELHHHYHHHMMASLKSDHHLCIYIHF